MDNYVEQTVSKERTIGSRALYGLAWVLTILFVLMGLFFAANVIGVSESDALGINWHSAIGCVLTLASAVALWRFKDKLNTEYDYVLSEGRLEVTRVLNNRRRSLCMRLELGKIQECGVYRVPKPGVKLERFHLDTLSGLIYICYEEKGERRMALLEPNEDMTAALRRGVQRNVWRDAEGKSSDYAGLYR